MKYHADSTFDAYQKERLLKIPDYDLCRDAAFCTMGTWEGVPQQYTKNSIHFIKSPYQSLYYGGP